MKRIYVTFVLLLIVACGFLGYKWYQSNQDYTEMLDQWSDYYSASEILANFITSIGDPGEEVSRDSIRRTLSTYGGQILSSVTWKTKDYSTELVVLENNSLWILPKGSSEYVRVI